MISLTVASQLQHVAIVNHSIASGGAPCRSWATLWSRILNCLSSLMTSLRWLRWACWDHVKS